MGIMKELAGLKSPDGTQASWNHGDPNTYDPNNPSAFYAPYYWYNDYTYQNLITQVNQRDRLYGNVSLTYKVNNDLSFKATYRKQQATTLSSTIFDSSLAQGIQTTGNEPRDKGYYAASNTYSNRENYEFLATYNKAIKDFNVTVNAGTDEFRSNYFDNSANTNNGLSVYGLYTVNNSVDAPSIGNTRQKEAYNAIFATGTFGYKTMITINGTLRNDWYSTLPADHNSQLSKSIGVAFVFSDLLKSQSSWLSSGKIRASYGEIPEALGTTNETYGYGRYPGSVYGVAAQKFGSNLIMGTNDGLVDPNIHGATKKQREIGMDLSFFNDRLGLTGTYWDGSENGLPGSINVNGASGYTSILTNYGRTSNTGVDFILSGTPISIKNFKWTVSATYSYLIKDKVDEISDQYGITSTLSLGSVYGTYLPNLYQFKGQDWGMLYGNGIARNAAGVPILTAAGAYTNQSNINFGSVLPKNTGGFQNSFTIFKDFDLHVNIDWQVGGKFASLSDDFGSYSGLTARTATVNDKGIPVRDPVANGGGIHVIGVTAAGAPVDTYVDNFSYWEANFNNKTGDEFIYDLTFIKMREVGLSYRIPVKKLGINKYVKNASFQVAGTDLFLIYAKTKDFDPSQVTNIQGETGQLPGTRGIGFNLKVGF
jgi:hypothetical protein